MFVEGLYSLPMAGDDRALLRIGELARRLGVSQDVLRAWERRYGLLEPVRSSGGFRLYTAADEQRVRRMQSHLARGLAAAEAARAALAEEGDRTVVAPPEPVPVERTSETAPDPAQADRGLTRLAADLRHALDTFDEPAAEAVLDRLFADFSVETALRELVLPYLHELGARWATNEVGVATEHFASNVLRARLAGLARGWGHGRGPCAVLACPPGEQHDLPLIAFGIVLHRNGWRIVYLGADTPLADLGRTVEETRPEIVVLAAVDVDRFQHSIAELAALGRHASLRLAGAGATASVADAVGAGVLAEDPVTEAQRLTPPV
jgi:MerR family transcriptional regulator, light-induced transcriptional regulator